ncbi:glycoside hydrolase family 3 C-terminal domain-containing protein [Thalassotalea aquiviva]|uniref:glycoside hydrolase family 3 C-terminal domain-containing protein n=1 Tax=Thalassotalea aquiviva TaxID=3242415 RepID=UPI00352B6B3A
MKKNPFAIKYCLFPLSLSVLILGCTNTELPATNSSQNNAYISTKAKRLANVDANVEAILQQMTLEEKISMVHASGKFHVDAIERLNLPELWLSDGPHGVRYQHEKYSWAPAGWDNDHATYLPHLTSVAASWNIEMAYAHGSVLGAEARDRGKDIILGPGVNLARLPLYGRNFEYMGEDPFLASALVVPEVKAIQAQDVAANVKHYALNTQELNRIGVNAKPDDRTLREIYLPVFEAAVKEGGVYSIMGAYNQYMGTNANQSRKLVKDILKDEWGFDGVLLTDWNVDINTYDAAMNGLDLEMGTNVESYDDFFFAKPLQAMVESGKVPMSVLDDKVRRVLRLMHRVGLMDPERKPGSRNTIEHQQIARKIASEGVILLKNEQQVLPLGADINNILVLGPNADRVHGLGGGSSEVKALYEITPLQGLKNALPNANITFLRARADKLMPIAADYIVSRHWTGTPAWTFTKYQDATKQVKLEENWIVQGEYSHSANEAGIYIEMGADIKPIKSGIHQLKLSLNGNASLKINGKQIFNNESDKTHIFTKQVELDANQTYRFELTYQSPEQGAGQYLLGWDAPGNPFVEQDVYLKAAQEADAVIYFGGLSHGDDREAIDRKDMRLPGGQDEVINKLLAVNDNTVIFMVAGSAVEMPWHQKASTIVWGWYGGMEAGNAFADVLFGDVNPSGKLPITLPEKLEHSAPIALNDYNAKESLYKEGVFIGYRWFEQQNIKPMFSFGHGLSYTQFKLDRLRVNKTTLFADQDLEVNVRVANVGKYPGAEVVQVYLQDVNASVPMPIKALKGFTKVYLEPGEVKTVTININPRAFAFWREDQGAWVTEPGEFVVHVGNSLDNIVASQRVDVLAR